MAKANQKAILKPSIKIKSSRITEANRQKEMRKRREKKMINKAKFGV